MKNKHAIMVARILNKDLSDYKSMGMDDRTIKQNLMHTAEGLGIDLITSEKVAALIIKNGGLK